MLKGVFITGTNTEIGKTTYARTLLRRHPEATYWKPVQTGFPPDDDTATVAARHSLPGLRYKDPVSPHLAAAREGDTITLARILAPIEGFAGTLVAEGAGGLLVPLAPGLLQTDLILAVGLPIVVVARDVLGTINHTLLTVDAARTRGIEVKGVVLLGGTNNRAAIEEYGDVAVIEDPLA
ncbi:MAG: dethiobiotin synthase [Planctomycetota bacterium]